MGNLSKLLDEHSNIVSELLNTYSSITEAEACNIATKIQHNKVLSDAFMLGLNSPSALEAIAMELGASVDGVSIKGALYNLKNTYEG